MASYFNLTLDTVAPGGVTLLANTDATVIVDDEELTNGDNEYTISVYGLSVDGRWSG